MIKTADKVLDKKNPADAEEIEALFDQLESEEVQESMAHLQQTIKTIEAALEVIKQRNFNEMSEEELAEVGEVIQNLDKFKIEMNMLVDDYLGQGALIQANLPEGMMAEPPSQFVGWGARDPSDPDFAFAPPTIPLAEASKDNMLKELIKVANELDKRGLVKEADKLDEITKEAIGRACWMLVLNLFACKDLPAMPGEVSFEFEDTTGDGLANKLRTSENARWMNKNGYTQNLDLHGTWEDSSETDIYVAWPCVGTSDPWHGKAMEPAEANEGLFNNSAEIVLKFSRKDSGTKDENEDVIWVWDINPVVHAAHPMPDCSGEDWNEYWTELAED